MIPCPEIFVRKHATCMPVCRPAPISGRDCCCYQSCREHEAAEIWLAGTRWGGQQGCWRRGLEVMNPVLPGHCHDGAALEPVNHPDVLGHRLIRCGARQCLPGIPA